MRMRTGPACILFFTGARLVAASTSTYSILKPRQQLSVISVMFRYQGNNI